MPSIYAITNATANGIDAELARLECALTGGLRLIQVRDKTLPASARLQLARGVMALANRYGDRDAGNLRGTTRTLDTIDGGVPLDPGLLSRDGWVVIDDSRTLVFDDGGWLRARVVGADAPHMQQLAVENRLAGDGMFYQVGIIHDAVRDYLILELSGTAAILY